jgi:hypothetical protein
MYHALRFEILLFLRLRVDRDEIIETACRVSLPLRQPFHRLGFFRHQIAIAYRLLVLVDAGSQSRQLAIVAGLHLSFPFDPKYFSCSIRLKSTDGRLWLFGCVAPKHNVRDKLRSRW